MSRNPGRQGEKDLLLSARRQGLGMEQLAALRDVDGEITEALGRSRTPTPADLTNAARLLIRYAAAASSPDDSPEQRLWLKVRAVVESWGLTVEELNRRCRELWASGYRPEAVVLDVGSGTDTLSS